MKKIRWSILCADSRERKPNKNGTLLFFMISIYFHSTLFLSRFLLFINVRMHASQRVSRYFDAFTYEQQAVSNHFVFIRMP